MEGHRLFVANRGEIAARIIHTAQRLTLATIAIYTPSDSLSPHVSLATESVELSVGLGESEAGPYLDVDGIVAVAVAHGATMVHPGYGFLSENASFARAVRDAGIGFLGPSTNIIETMGLKHEARAIAKKAGVPIIPGELAGTIEQAVSIAQHIGYPILLKPSAGGGGMGMVACSDEKELLSMFEPIRARAKSLFKNEAVLLERYYTEAHHIEVQVFGNGQGHVVHMGERECSLQRRHQKVVEETPSPFLEDRPPLRDDICASAVRLCKAINYGSAGTVEFLVDDLSGSFFFLEMNTRIQVEHGITEVARGSLDLIELMILHGVEETKHSCLSKEHLQQDQYDSIPPVHAIEARIYAENPAENFRPSPGILQLVDWTPNKQAPPEWLRVDTWVSTGMTVTPYFDPLLAKVIVTAPTRDVALQRMAQSLRDIRVLGPTTNVHYLLNLVEDSEDVRAGHTTTRYLSTFAYTPRAFIVMHPGLSSLVQDVPGRPKLLRGIPPSGAMDVRAHKVANMLAGNAPGTETLEVISVRGAAVRLKFWVHAVVGVAGGQHNLSVHLDGRYLCGMWSRISVEPGAILELVEGERGESGGFRAYIAIRGGFPDIPQYLGSKSTSMGFGGYQGRALAAGDQLELAKPPEEAVGTYTLPSSLVPVYPKHWVLRVVCGPHDGPEFITPEGAEKFYSMMWAVSPSSNRMGIRLAPASEQSGSNERTILWARVDGGQGGSHPSNILDNAYARGAVNVNGDTPVILGCEGPDMGGYVCLCAVAQCDLWKLGQLHPGCTLTFQCVSSEAAHDAMREENKWLEAIQNAVQGLSESTADDNTLSRSPVPATVEERSAFNAQLHVIEQDRERPHAVFRQAGDSAILVEYGPMALDFTVRARIHALETSMAEKHTKGILGFAACIRSTMCHFDPASISQREVLALLLDAENALPRSTTDMVFSGRRITLPIVLDDRWSRDALARYMRTTRDSAVYLPSNIQYLANNNGLQSEHEALEKLIQSDWMIFGVGFYLACPFLVPIDPRARLVGQKMNPSRTYTPRGAIGIAGIVAAIYPIESPGGYQLYGRTIPGWHAWGKGWDFAPDRPWLLNPFDQVRFEPVSEEAYVQLERDFDAGRYAFKIEPCEFSIAEHLRFVESIQEEVRAFRKHQAAAAAVEEARESGLLREWESTQRAAEAAQSVDDDADTGDADDVVVAPLSASVWKIRCALGDVVKNAGDVFVILEAMKTEINVAAGAEHVGKTVRGFGGGVREGAVVGSGDVLVRLS